MKEFAEKIWSWSGWPKWKWLFAPFLLIFILYLIWSLETVPAFDKKIIIDFKNSFKVDLKPSFSLIKEHLSSPPLK